MGLSDLFSGSKAKAPDLSFLADLSNLEFLRDKRVQSPDAASGFGHSEGLFRDYISSIGGEQSTDEVRSELDNDIIRQALEEIDRDTGQSLATTEMDQFERGLYGPGVSSDIAEVARAQVVGDGGRRKAQARTTLADTQLGRIEDRETRRRDAMTSAFGGRYGVGAQTDAQLLRDVLGLNADRDIQFANMVNQRDLGRGQISADVFRTQQRQDQEGLFNSMLRNFGTQFAGNFGRTLGTNAAGGTTNAIKALPIFNRGGG